MPQKPSTGHVVQTVQYGHHSGRHPSRSITSSEAKASLVELLGSLTTEGPVEITRNGRKVAILSAPPVRTNASDAARLAELAKQYAGGRVAWRDIAAETEVGFVDLLDELSKQKVIRDLRKPGAQEVADWIRSHEGMGVRVASTEVFEDFQVISATRQVTKTAGRGEQAAAEVLSKVIANENHGAILLFEDSDVRKQNFLVQLLDEVLVISTSEFLFGLEGVGCPAQRTFFKERRRFEATRFRGEPLEEPPQQKCKLGRRGCKGLALDAGAGGWAGWAGGRVSPRSLTSVQKSLRPNDVWQFGRLAERRQEKPDPILFN